MAGEGYQIFNIIIKVRKIGSIFLRCYYQEEIYRLVWEADKFLQKKNNDEKI